MKTIITSLALAMLTSTAVKAQDEPTMEQSLTTTFSQFDTTMNLAIMMPLSAQLDLIANKYADQWQAQYYAAYAKVTISYVEPDAKRKDLLLDEADMFLQRIVDLKPTSEELYVLTALVANGRLAVDPENRYMKYGKIFEENLNLVKEKNPDNPRYYYLKGVSKFYTPELWGGGNKVAKPLLDKAKELCGKQDKTTILKPYWCELQTDYYLAEIAKAQALKDEKKSKKGKKD